MNISSVKKNTSMSNDQLANDESRHTDDDLVFVSVPNHLDNGESGPDLNNFRIAVESGVYSISTDGVLRLHDESVSDSDDESASDSDVPELESASDSDMPELESASESDVPELESASDSDAPELKSASESDVPELKESAQNTKEPNLTHAMFTHAMFMQWVKYEEEKKKEEDCEEEEQKENPVNPEPSAQYAKFVEWTREEEARKRGGSTIFTVDRKHSLWVNCPGLIPSTSFTSKEGLMMLKLCIERTKSLIKTCVPLSEFDLTTLLFNLWKVSQLADRFEKLPTKEQRAYKDYLIMFVFVKIPYGSMVLPAVIRTIDKYFGTDGCESKEEEETEEEEEKKTASETNSNSNANQAQSPSPPPPSASPYSSLIGIARQTLKVASTFLDAMG